MSDNYKIQSERQSKAPTDRASISSIQANPETEQAVIGSQVISSDPMIITTTEPSAPTSPLYTYLIIALGSLFGVAVLIFFLSLV